jgi:hypothetical protein
MQHKKTQLEVPSARFCERSSSRSFVADLRSIISAAHKLPAEVAPPARVWGSLRAQLEIEGILGRPVQGRLEKHTRFPMF